ncbi:MAG: DNA repair exonuclease, partial [Proteobacteria bacterium]|nr:DNA repair exonuclease [Pseudomonadota bacterium]
MPNKVNIRLFLIADTHLGFDCPVKPRIERRRRGTDFFANYERVLRYAAETRPDLVVHGGDFFFRSRVSEKIADHAYGSLLKFARSGIPVFIVPGNHERSRLPFAEKIQHPTIHVFDKARTYIIKTQGATIALSGFPFVRRSFRERFGTLLDETGWRTHSSHIRLLVMHQTVEGARVGPSDFTFRNGSDVVPMTDIPVEFSAVLCGHIHRRQILVHRTENRLVKRTVVYAGSTERTSFAERNEDKGFFEIVFRPDHKHQWHIHQSRFIRLPARPMFDIPIGSGINGRNVKSYLLSQISEIHPDAIVRLQLSNDTDDGIKKI